MTSSALVEERLRGMIRMGYMHVINNYACIDTRFL